jgi:pimeloyl-ACP methyl ester carboxylesterase
VADKLLIVHGYSDGSTSFTGLADFLVSEGIYKPDHVFYLDYSSMDDDATFRDFADKLDADHRTRLGQERVDVVCHSTGSLVVRAWLALHA